MQIQCKANLDSKNNAKKYCERRYCQNHRRAKPEVLFDAPENCLKVSKAYSNLEGSTGASPLRQLASQQTPGDQKKVRARYPTMAKQRFGGPQDSVDFRCQVKFWPGHLHRSQRPPISPADLTRARSQQLGTQLLQNDQPTKHGQHPRQSVPSPDEG